VEIARDIAIKFNNEHGEIFTLPEAKIDENVATVPGTNGEKMSKSYGNTIDIFADAKTLKKQISSIVTDGTPLEEPKQWQNCNVFKAYLNELVWDYFKDAREKFEYYQNNPDEVAKILDLGAKKAQNVAHETIEKVREAVGIYR
ncbi:MAG: tryptophan--tRNA ligase, partial [Campylobacter concisus]|nr:tryptophan--tRNA ligase [Campylobacter concisus]